MPLADTASKLDATVEPQVPGLPPGTMVRIGQQRFRSVEARRGPRVGIRSLIPGRFVKLRFPGSPGRKIPQGGRPGQRGPLAPRGTTLRAAGQPAAAPSGVLLQSWRRISTASRHRPTGSRSAPTRTHPATGSGPFRIRYRMSSRRILGIGGIASLLPPRWLGGDRCFRRIRRAPMALTLRAQSPDGVELTIPLRDPDAAPPLPWSAHLSRGEAGSFRGRSW